MAGCCGDSGAEVGVVVREVAVPAKGVVCVWGTWSVAGGNPGSDEHAISRVAMAQTMAMGNLMAIFYLIV